MINVKKLIIYGFLILSILSQSFRVSSSTLFPLVEDFTGRSGFLSSDHYVYGTNKSNIPLTSNGLRLLNREGSRGSFVMNRLKHDSVDDTGFSTYFKFKVQSASADGFGILFSDELVSNIGPIGGGISYPPAGPTEDFAVMFDWWGREKIEFIQRIPGTQSRQQLAVYNDVRATMYNTLHIWVDYAFTDEGGELYVYHSNTDTRPENPSMVRTVSETFSQDGVYIGVLAATGGATMRAYLQEKIIADRFIESSIDVTSEIASDTEPPSITHHITEPTNNNYQITLSAIDPAVTLEDSTQISGSGLASLEYSINGNDFLPYNGSPIAIDAAGTLEYRASDKANNVTSQTIEFHQFDWVKRSTHLINLDSGTSVDLTGEYYDLSAFESTAIDELVTFNGISYQFKGWYSDPYFIHAITNVTITANTEVFGKYVQTYDPSRNIPANTSSGSITITQLGVDDFQFNELVISNGAFQHTISSPTTSIDLTDVVTETDLHVYTNGAIVSYHAFSVETTNKSWEDAKTYCEAEGGYIATVTSLEEWMFILDIAPSGDVYWLGGTDKDGEGTWQWENNEGVIPTRTKTSADNTFQAWSSNEPNDLNNQNYMVLWGKSADNESYLGWDDQSNSNGPHAFICEYQNFNFYDSSEDLEITESHSLIHYPATLNLNNSQTNVTLEIAKGTILSNIPEPTRDGFTFAGWYTDPSLNSPVGSATMSAATSLYAKWGPKEYSIEYRLSIDPDITTITNANITTFESDETVTLISPEAIGFTFEGWFNNLNYVGTSISAIESGTTTNQILYGKWSAVPSTIVFNNTFGENVEDINAGFADGIVLPELERPGFTFDGWFLEGTLFTSTFVPLGETVLTDAWTPVQNTLTFDSNGGSAVDAITADYESPISLPTPRRQGFTFTGWFVEGEKVAYTAMPLNNQTLTARWSANTYTLNLSNNVNADQSTIQAAFKASVNLPVISMDGYTFKGWFENGQAVNYTRMPLGNRNLTAILEPNTYTVTFNTGLADAIPALDAPYQSSIRLPQPSLDNHAFDGWFMNGSKVNLTTMPLGGATLTAQFTPLESTLTFIHPDGDAVSPLTTLIGDAIQLPTLTKPGHTFDGWFKDGSSINLDTMPDESLTLTAQFTVNQYTLTIRGFENVVIERQTADYGTSVALPEVSQPGYLLSGWTLNGNAVNGASMTMPEGGGTLQAQFDPILYPVTWVHHDEVVEMQLPFASDIPLNPSNVTGYAFEGWMHNGSPVDQLTVPLDGVTVTALYDPYTSHQTIITPNQNIRMTHTTDQPFTGQNLSPPGPLIFSGYFSEPFGGGTRFDATTMIENGQVARVHPYVFNPTAVYDEPGVQMLSLYSRAKPIDASSPEPAPSQDPSIYFSLLTWGIGLIGLAIYHERRRN